MEIGELCELPQGEAPTYDEWVAAAEDLGPEAKPEEVEASAKAYAKKRNAF